MGWIRKTIRKVGSELGRAVENVGNIFGSKSLGILGTIGLSILMPWTVSTVFNGLTNPSGWFAKTALSLGQDEGLARKTAGYIMTGIHNGATATQQGYTIAKSFLTDKVSEGLDWISGQEKKPKDFIIKDSPLNEEITIPSVDTKTDVAKEILSNTYSDNRESKGILNRTKKYVQEKSKSLIANQLDITDTTRNATTAGDLGDGLGYNFVAHRKAPARANELNLKLANSGFYYGNNNYVEDIKNSSFGQSEYYNFFKEIKTDRTLSV
jgi:hypothetical protein